MRRLIGGVLMVTGSVVLVFGLVAGIQMLGRYRPEQEPERDDDAGIEEVPSKTRHFSIKRTKSEVGYVYWILEGFGKYKCYLLCDTWDEAVEQARSRLAQVDQAALAAAN